MNTDKINAITETILDNIHDDALMEILYNVVKYAVEHNNSKTNWTAREIFTDIVSDFMYFRNIIQLSDTPNAESNRSADSSSTLPEEGRRVAYLPLSLPTHILSSKPAPQRAVSSISHWCGPFLS